MGGGGLDILMGGGGLDILMGGGTRYINGGGGSTAEWSMIPSEEEVANSIMFGFTEHNGTFPVP